MFPKPTYSFRSLSSTIMFLLSSAIAAQERPIDTALANQYFQEIHTICSQDNGKLWGISLQGPMLFAHPATRTVVANQADLDGNLTQQGGVFVGRLPDEVGIANTATRWAGIKWAMISWPLPEDKADRMRLIVHESFHRIQEDIGFPGANPANNHLDTREGRIWLQLEWRALESALRQRGTERRKAIEDALIFRAYRRSLFPNAASEERAMEMHEGLAEYTGVKLSEIPDSALADLLQERSRKYQTFPRSFAYASGPVYGILLDESGANWRKGLKPEDDLGVLLQKAHAIQLPGDLKHEAEMRAKNYDGNNLQASETEREIHRQKRITEYRARLVDGPVLILPLTERVEYTFSPYDLVPLDDLGTVYPTLGVTDDWGSLTISNGALMTREGERVARVYVPAPTDANARPLQGDGWTLQRNDNWKLQPSAREGDYLLTRVAP